MLNLQQSLLDKKILVFSLKESFKKLLPHYQFRNPPMFVTYVGAIFTTILLLQQWMNGHHSSFDLQIVIWLWFTVLSANFASAIAESRGKAQAASLKKTQFETLAKKLVGEEIKNVLATTLKKDDLVICEVGDIIPADGEVIEGIATVDESAITGESAPVIRESGGDRSAVTSGTHILSDRLVIRITADKGHSFLDRMISLIEGAQRQKTPNEIALNIILTSQTIIFLITVVSLKLFADYSAVAAEQNLSSMITIPVLIALLVCLIPTTISALLNAIGIAGMDRLIQRNVIAKSGRAVEAAGDIDFLILDKTGTITLGNRMATEFFPAPKINEKDFAEVAQLSSLSDETPEGRSIVVLAKKKFKLRGETLDTKTTYFIPFSSNTRMSGLNFIDEQGRVYREIRKGAVDAIQQYIEKKNGVFPAELYAVVDMISSKGGTPLLVTDGNKVMGVIHLKDVIKRGIKERFAELRKAGIRTVMVTGDNALTAGAIAAEAGVDDFISQASPEKKLQLIRDQQNAGHLIAMTGDGTNDAPALAQADVGVAMNTGTQASREAGNMVDMDSNPTKLLDIVEVGKQLLITRGAVTTFSIANDVAKYFAIVPALFGYLYATTPFKGPLNALNVMNLETPQSAVLSTIIFNAFIILLLIPLALRGVSYQALPASELLKKHLLIYGLGGLITPFLFIKLIDISLNFFKII